MTTNIIKKEVKAGELLTLMFDSYDDYHYKEVVVVLKDFDPEVELLKYIDDVEGHTREEAEVWRGSTYLSGGNGEELLGYFKKEGMVAEVVGRLVQMYSDAVYFGVQDAK